MTSIESWTCDGLPKNGDRYPEVEPYEHHEPQVNYGADCAICGLPKAAMDLPDVSFPLKSLMITFIIVAIVIGGGVSYSVLSQRCPSGLQKIDGECADPYLQVYESAKRQGEIAVNLAKNYKNLADLEQAQSALALVFAQLHQIPQDAKIYEEAATQLESYRSIPEKINVNLQKEKKAQQELEKAQSIAQSALTQSDTATSIEQLISVKKQWQAAQAKIQEISPDTLVVDRIQQLQSEYTNKISELDRRIATITVPSVARPKKSIPRVVTPVKSPPTPQTVEAAPVKPLVDLCAVDNPPENCLF